MRMAPRDGRGRQGENKDPNDPLLLAKAGERSRNRPNQPRHIDSKQERVERDHQETDQPCRKVGKKPWKQRSSSRVPQEHGSRPKRPYMPRMPKGMQIGRRPEHTHQKNTPHRQPRNQFLCPTCQKEFNSENTMKNHAKRCQGERRVGGSVQCKQCGAWITATNFARHRKRCCPNQPRSPNPRTYKVKYVECPQCTFPQAATNLARHLRTCRNRRGESVPSARG